MSLPEETIDLLNKIKKPEYRNIFEYILHKQEQNYDNLYKEQQRLMDDFLSRGLFGIEEINTKIDRLTGNVSGGKVVQKKRGGIKKRIGAPKRQNIVAWIKNEYCENGIKFFDFINDAENVINEYLTSTEGKKFVGKLSGEKKKKKEADFIWKQLKKIDEVNKTIYEKHEEYKEKQKKINTKLAEIDSNSELSE